MHFSLPIFHFHLFRGIENWRIRWFNVPISFFLPLHLLNSIHTPQLAVRLPSISQIVLGSFIARYCIAIAQIANVYFFSLEIKTAFIVRPLDNSKRYSCHRINQLESYDMRFCCFVYSKRSIISYFHSVTTVFLLFNCGRMSFMFIFGYYHSTSYILFC